jgi:ubiquinone/menaquinone biosynthesis C-methylase UbiE
MSGQTERPNLAVHSSPELYDRYTSEGVDAYDRVFIERFMDEYRRLGRAGLRCLDLCTGTGQLVIKLATTPGAEAVSFEAFDLFDDMLDIARTNVRAAGLDGRIRITKADVHALPYADGEFEMMMGRSIVHHWANPVLAFREIDRVLAPGGVCLIHEPRRDPSDEALEAANADRSRIGVNPFNLEEKYTAGEVSEQLREAGVAKFDIFAPGAGPESIGFEIRIEKKRGAGQG